MLDVIGASSIEQVVGEIVPADIRLSSPLSLPAPDTEYAYHQRLRRLGAMNRVFRTYIGMGLIAAGRDHPERLENRDGITPYALPGGNAQGRLESLLNFQTMVSDSDLEGRERVVAGRATAAPRRWRCRCASTSG
jgi:glycine dehydrogenase